MKNYHKKDKILKKVKTNVQKFEDILCMNEECLKEYNML